MPREAAPPRRIGLRARVTVAFAGLALLLSATLAIFAYELTRAFLIDRREQSAKQEAFLNARAVRDELRVNALDVSEALREAQTGSEGAVVLRVGDQWFGTSVGVGRDDVPRSLRRMVANGDAGTQNTALGSSPNIGVGVPLPAVDGAFFEFTPAQEVEQTLSLLARALTAAALLATVLGAVVGRYASGRVLRPVRRMALTASGIADGALDERLDAEGDSDLEPLVDAFNSMVLALRNRIEREARFASNVSHELRTPIATMTAALNVARRRGSGEAAEQALDLLEQELQKFRQLVLDLLEVSRMEGGVAETELERVDPAALVREVLRSTERTDVAVEVDGSAPAVCMIDRRRIAQVLTNLLDNADAYGDGATRIVVSGTSDAVLIAVDDAGPGVAPEERLHVFERFARGVASESKPGTGLGLALVAEHVRLHDGRVWVDDAPDGGARFVVQLPREAS